MNEDFVEPDEQEYDRHTSVIAKMASLRPFPAGVPFPTMCAIALICYGRPHRNVELQWTLDESGVVEDSMRALKRHLDIIRWTFEKAQPDKLPTLNEIMPPAEIAGVEAALADPDSLRRSISEQFLRFMRFTEKRRKLTT